jgi:hypothetical protein
VSIIIIMPQVQRILSTFGASRLMLMLILLLALISTSLAHQGSHVVHDDATMTTTTTATQTESASPHARRLWMAHGILMSISWGFLAPLAIGCSVLRRTRLFPQQPAGGVSGRVWWFLLHSNLNSLVFATTAAGFSIAVYNIHVSGEAQFECYKHSLIGLIVMCLLTAQVASGWCRPHKRVQDVVVSSDYGSGMEDKNANTPEGSADDEEEAQVDDVNKPSVGYSKSGPPESKSTLRILFEFQHPILGTSILILAMYQCTSGITIYDAEFGIAFPAQAVFWAIAGSIFGMVIVSRLAFRRRDDHEVENR